MKYLLILLLGIILVFSKCNNSDKDCHNTITIVNNSDKTIYFYPSSAYPDTLALGPNPLTSGEDFKIGRLSRKDDVYRSCIEGKFSFTAKYMYFIYDAQTVESTPWDTIMRKYLILKRYDLSLADLQKSNWTIKYP